MADVPADTERIEALPLSTDVKAPPTAGLAIEMLCGSFAGLGTFGTFDVREGSVDISLDEPRVTILCRDRTGKPIAITYGGTAQTSVRLVSIPIPTIRALVRALS